MGNGTYGVWTREARADASTNPNNQPNNRGSEVGLFGGHFIPLDRIHNSAHAQLTGGAIHHVVQQHGSGYHRADRDYTSGHDAADVEATQADAGYECPSTKAKRDSGPVRQRSVSNLPRNHAPLPRGGGKPYWLSGPYGRADAHPDWPLQGIDSDCVLKARRLGRPFGKALHLDSRGANLLGRTVELQLPLAGPRPVRSYQPNNAGAGLRYHLDPAKDDHAAELGSQAGGQSGYDAVADAADDRLFLVHIAQRPGPLLDSFQHPGHRDSVFRKRWLGAPIPAISQSRTAGSTSGKQAI